MAIADYTDLEEAVKRTLARTDAAFSAAFPGFVAQAEERIYNGFGRPGEALYSPPLRVRAMEHTATVTVADGVGTLPADYLGMRAISQANAIPLAYVTPDEYRSAMTGSGTPQAYTIEVDSLKTWPVWSGDLSLLYWRRFNALTSGGGDFTNNLLIAHPSIFEVAVRGEAFRFSRNTDAELREAQRLAGMITAANATARNQRYGGRMQVRLRSGGIG